MQLDQFFPYRLAVLSDAVSRATALVYSDRFDLTRDQWRVLAALANKKQMKTTGLIAHTTLDKMQVSRALARMVENGLVERRTDTEDRRGHRLRLLPAGETLFRKIVPKVQQRAQFLLDALTPEESAQLGDMMDRLLAKARKLNSGNAS